MPYTVAEGLKIEPAEHGGFGGTMSTRILVVDDELRICRFISRALGAQGFVVDVAGSGHEALRLVETHDYGVIVLDLLLPDINGYHVLRRIVEAKPSRKVLVVSAVGDVESKVNCLKAGAVDYLPKPFAIAELIARVKRRLEEASSPAPGRWLYGGKVRLDLQRRALQVDEREVPLTQREFILLCYLMRHAGEVCTRDELLADVWGYSFDPGSNVVDVCVRRLRSKIVEHRLIETVRSVGYSFIAS
jgi:two-component system, OmpR family, response regulator